MIQSLGDHYFARPLRVSDVDGPYPSWFEDQEVCRFNSHGKFFKTEQQFRDFAAGLGGEDRVVWAVCHDTDGHIGNVSLQEISFIDRSAEFAILIGDRCHWRRGVSLAAGLAIVAHGFEKLNLHRIGCGTAATNAGMRRLAERLGMAEEGTRRQALFLEGAWIDVVVYGVLRDEFRRAARL